MYRTVNYLLLPGASVCFQAKTRPLWSLPVPWGAPCCWTMRPRGPSCAALTPANPPAPTCTSATCCQVWYSTMHSMVLPGIFHSTMHSMVLPGIFLSTMHSMVLVALISSQNRPNLIIYAFLILISNLNYGFVGHF